jgi:hypothetical protein
MATHEESYAEACMDEAMLHRQRSQDRKTSAKLMDTGQLQHLEVLRPKIHNGHDYVTEYRALRGQNPFMKPELNRVTTKNITRDIPKTSIFDDSTQDSAQKLRNLINTFYRKYFQGFIQTNYIRIPRSSQVYTLRLTNRKQTYSMPRASPLV